MSTLFQQINVNRIQDVVENPVFSIIKEKIEKTICVIEQPFEIFTDVNPKCGLREYFSQERINEREFIPLRFIDPDKTNGLFVNYLPIIHYHSHLEFSKKGRRHIEQQPYAHRNLNYLDSSIWHFSAWDWKSLCRAIKQIQNYKNYYSLIIACENANLSRRIFEQSLIHRGRSSNPNCDSSHSGSVVPFVFHSEFVMRRNICREIKKIVPIKRRVLFIDDHSCIPMNSIEGTSNTLTKTDIVKARLSEIAKFYKLGIDELFEFHSIQTLAEIKTLKDKKFDIILIDYLLGEINTRREYGYEVLRYIEDNIEDLKISKGPMGKFWIMFTSAFTYAVQERLLAEGYSHSQKNWYIGRTACPTTTPELFKYNLLSLMKRQLEYITEVGGDDENLSVITLIDFLEFLFKEPENIRLKTSKYFNLLLHLRARYDLLKKDYYIGGKENLKAVENGSPMIKALFPDMSCYTNAFWEHIQHLIYLIAYGNILQWNEMWDEYIFVKENLKKAEIATGMIGICKQIENYIINIKSANFK